MRRVRRCVHEHKCGSQEVIEQVKYGKEAEDDDGDELIKCTHLVRAFVRTVARTQALAPPTASAEVSEILQLI